MLFIVSISVYTPGDTLRDFASLTHFSVTKELFDVQQHRIRPHGAMA